MQRQDTTSFSFDKGLTIDEAMLLLERTSGIHTAAAGTPARQSQEQLVTELDRLPLAVSTAGLVIAYQRQASTRR